MATGPEWDVAAADFAPTPERLMIAARPTGAADAPWGLYLLDRARGESVPLTPGGEEGDALEVSVGR